MKKKSVWVYGHFWALLPSPRVFLSHKPDSLRKDLEQRIYTSLSPPYHVLRNWGIWDILNLSYNINTTALECLKSAQNDSHLPPSPLLPSFGIGEGSEVVFKSWSWGRKGHWNSTTTIFYFLPPQILNTCDIMKSLCFSLKATF